MEKCEKTIVTQDDLFEVLNLFDSLGIPYWLDGGWGVDVLVGKQTRDHRDVDIDYDSIYTEKLLEFLSDKGYLVTTDWKPVRIELYHSRLGYLDVHPFILSDDGTAKQADLNGGWYEFDADYFGFAVFQGRSVPCISLRGQSVFHTGYELREKDLHDINNIESLIKRKGMIR